MSAAEQESSDFSITLSASKRTCYVGEEVELALEIESGLSTIDIGFSRYDLNLPATFLEEVLPVEKTGNRAVIRRRVVPLSSGTVAVGPAKIYSMLIMAGGTGGEGMVRKATLVSNELRMRVLPLPKDGGPKGVKCPVGEYEFRVRPRRESAQVGEDVVLEYEISGKGSMRTFVLPRVGHSERISAGRIRGQELMTDSETGTKRLVYTQELVPLSTRVAEIPSIEFVYFDPSSEEYVSLKEGPFLLDVTASVRSEEAPSGENASGTSECRGGRTEGIRGIKTELGNIRSESVRTIYSPTFWYIQAIPFVSLIISAAYAAYRSRVDSVVLHNFRRAHPRSKKELKRAKRLLKAGEVEECFKMLPKILAGYVGDKLNVPSGGITNAEVLHHIRSYTTRKRFLRQVEALVRVIGRSRYTREGLDPNKVKRWLKSTEKVIHWMAWHRIFRRVEREYRRALSEETV